MIDPLALLTAYGECAAAAWFVACLVFLLGLAKDKER